MALVNDHFLKLPGAGYLFADVAKRVNVFKAQHPKSDVISLGIGDVTQPLCPAVIEALHRAADEMASAATFAGGALRSFGLTSAETNRLLARMCEETERMHFMDATDVLLAAEGPEDLRTSDGRYFMPQYFRRDQIHLNKAGHDVWTGKMKEMLKRIGICA